MTPPAPLEQITSITVGQFELGALALVRVSSMVALLPVLGSVSVPRQAKIGLALALTVCIFPTLAHSGAKLPDSVFGFAGLALREAAIGLLAGWSFSMVFQVSEFAGALIDMQAGYSMIELFDPTTGESTHLFGQFLGIAATISFMAGGGHAHLVAALADSFRAVPLAQSHIQSALVLQDLLALTGRAVLLGFQMAGPVLMSLLMISLVMAVVSRVMPSLNAWILAMPLQVVTACSVTAITLPMLLGVFHGWEDEVFHATSKLVAGMR